MRLLTKCIAFLLLICINNLVFAETEENTKSWNTAIITGSLSSDHKIKYYLQPNISFIDDKYKFQGAFLYAGVGYQKTSSLILWIMNGYFYNLGTNGKINRFDTVREQADWNIYHDNTLSLGSTTRFEQRKNLDESQWLLRFREKITMVRPFQSWENHGLVVFDEVFFNLNHPQWINSNAFFEQNRAFLGIRTVISNRSSFDLGYMNQYQNRNTDIMSNILYLIFHVQLE